MLVRSSLSTAELCFTSSHAKSFLPSLLKRNMSSRKPSKSPLPPASAAKSSSDVGGFDPRNSERATRLRSAFTNRSSKQFTELIGDEWRYCFSRLPLHPLELSEPTADYGVDIARNLSTAIPTLLLIHNSERFDVQVNPGLSDLAKDNLPLSFGCTISVVQVYNGILLLRY
ncbi:hypothetical protein B296_00048538 [Ensete ventricosum]|uniref:Uncharacterized protein n=1 Tax=Ensete ventricosum TaxID=4639 RepID=A0A426XWC9_ENSVE|nr:hypothetical protein B296_00048538 [Ensete ventricosum]